jgi:2-polyprenyl-6-methoxyphenol hydroxylase-like FAD-dependent oxidoreductase
MIVTQSIHKPGAKYVDPIGDHLIWVLISSRSAYGDANPKAMDGETIRRIALKMTENWHPAFRRLIVDSDSTQVSAVPVLTSLPVEPWPSTNITVLGDAIHTMTPLQGLGGSSALRDAALLCQKLIEADRGGRHPVNAIREYEKLMINYGFAAVRRSAWFARIVVSNSRLIRNVLKMVLRVTTSIPLLTRQMFRPSV